MIALDNLIKSAAASSIFETEQTKQKRLKYLQWLTELRDEVGGGVMVSGTAVKAAAAWVNPKEYAEHLRKRDGVE